jgi:RNA polymerase sigma factor (sigma-70 family)
MIHAIATMPEVNVDSSVDLLLKAQSGDNDALNRLLARYLPRLRRWASGRLPWGLRTMLDTGDLVQDAVVNALPHLKGLEIRSDHALQFYLQRAVKNRIIDLHKRGQRRPMREEIPDEIMAAGTSPLEAAIGIEAFERYESALTSLKKEQRQLIVLRVELGLNYEEIAALVGKPSPAAARMAVIRAIARLADEMGPGRPPDASGHGT